MNLIHDRYSSYDFPIPKVAFNIAIPMRHIRVCGGLIKGDSWEAIYGVAVAGVGKVVLSELASSVPIVQPNDVRKVNLYKSIAANNVIPVSFRMRQCGTFSLPQSRSTVWRLGVCSPPEKCRWVPVGL